MTNLISSLFPDLRGGGAERIGIDLAYEFTSAGHKVEFALMQARGELLEEARQSFPVVDLATPRARALPLTLARYLRRRRPDALPAAMLPLTVIAPLGARLSGHRCQVSEYGILSAQYRVWGRGHGVALRASMAVGYRLAASGAPRGCIFEGGRRYRHPLGDRRDAFDVIHNPVPPRPEPSSRAIRDAEVLWSGPTARASSLSAVLRRSRTTRCCAIGAQARGITRFGEAP